MPNYKMHKLKKTPFDSYLVRITLTCIAYTILSDIYHHASIMKLYVNYCKLIIGPSRRLITSNKRTANKIPAKEYNNYGMHYTKEITFNTTG